MKYIFYLPNYVPYSNGIKSLWYAAYLFSKYRETLIITFDGGEIGKYEIPSIYREILRKKKIVSDVDIVIYPDMVKGNPLKVEKIARYLMAKPYILNGEGIDIGSGDFLISFSHAVDRKLTQLNTLLPELKQLAKYKKDEKNKTVVIYYGKCRISLGETIIKKIIDDFDNVKIVTRTIPSSKEALYEEIAKASLFVSFDPLSSLAYEANLVGTPSLLMDTIFSEEFDGFNHKLFGFYYNYSELKNEDLGVLGREIFNESHADLNNVLVKNEEVVQSVISKIEDWFQGENKVNSSFELESIKFYNEKWMASPIINCTSLESVIAYNLIRRNIICFIGAILLNRFKQMGLAMWHGAENMKSKLIGVLFTTAQAHMISYILNPRRKMVKLKKANTAGDSVLKQDSAFHLNNGFLSILWRFICK